MLWRGKHLPLQSRLPGDASHGDPGGGEPGRLWVIEAKQMEGEASSGPREMVGACASKQGGWLGGRDGFRGASQHWQDGIQGQKERWGS